MNNAITTIGDAFALVASLVFVTLFGVMLVVTLTPVMLGWIVFGVASRLGDVVRAMARSWRDRKYRR